MQSGNDNQPRYLPDSNALYDAATDYFQTFKKARETMPGITFRDMPVTPTLAQSRLPQSRDIAAAIASGTLVTATFVRETLMKQLPGIVHSVFSPKASLGDKTLSNFTAAITKARDENILTHDEYIGRDVKDAIRNKQLNWQDGEEPPSDLRELAIREVRHRIETVAPEQLQSSLLLNRKWYDSGTSSEIPAALRDAPPDIVKAAIRMRDEGTSSLNKPMDWEDLVILAIAVQHLLRKGGSIILASADKSLCQAIAALSLHPQPTDPPYVACLGVQPYQNIGGTWRAGDAIAPRNSLSPPDPGQAKTQTTPPQPTTTEKTHVSVSTRGRRTIEATQEPARRTP